MTKTNKPFATIIIEDFSSTYRFNLFGKDFIEYGKYFGKDWPVLIKAKIQPRAYGDTNELEFKPYQVFLLNEARDEMVKSVSLKMAIDNITDEWVTLINKNTETKEGKILLKFIVYDLAEGIKVDMVSRNRKVKISNEFLTFIKTYPEVEMTVN